MKLTFEGIIEKVVNNKTLSRKEKLNAIRVFLKEHSGPNKPTEEKDIEALATIKAIKQTYTQQEANEKLRDKNQ
jgi:hypothetical protein